MVYCIKNQKIRSHQSKIDKKQENPLILMSEPLYFGLYSSFEDINKPKHEPTSLFLNN